MEYLVRSVAGTHGYIQFEHPQESDAARCAVFQAVCPECEQPIPTEGPSVTFRSPSANPGESVTYLVTVHLNCAPVVEKRIRVSMGEECQCGESRTYFLHRPASECRGCNAPQDHHEFGEQDEVEPIDAPCAYCGAQPMEPCAPDCLSSEGA